jgi:hypothetical protein
MPRRSQREAVAERVEARLEDQQQRRREAAQRGAQTRRQRREQQEAEGQPQVAVEGGTQGHVARNMPPRVHADLLTVAIRGPIAAKMRVMSENTGMSLAKLLKDALLMYEGGICDGYEPGSRLRAWLDQDPGDRGNEPGEMD